MRTISLDHARRLALTAQGFHRARPAPGVRRDVRHLRRVLDTVDIVQLDSVNVLARAHEMPFWSRIGAHDRAARDAWLWRSREAFEGWVHMASVTPIDVWPLLHHRRLGARGWDSAVELVDKDPDYLDRVLDEVADNGPTSVQDLAEPGRRTGPWWGMSRGRVALDYLSIRGHLAVDHRTPQFVAVYDLAERVIPGHARDAEVPPLDEARLRLLLRAARSLGIGTAEDLADHHRMGVRDARPAIARLVAEGKLEEVRVRGWQDRAAFVHPDARRARSFPTRALLSPFDPLLWFRDRAERLFGFHYRIEIYVPAAKRRYGYYVLPFLIGDRLVARIDLKAERGSGRLLVRGAFAEAGVDRVAVARELAAELAELGAWLEVPDIVVESKGDLVASLRRLL